MNKLAFAMFTTLAAAVLFSAGTATAQTIRTVALRGQAAPGTPTGVNYHTFSVPVLNDVGQTAFVASLRGSGVTGENENGIWSEGMGSLALIARAGNPAPGTFSGVNYSDFNLPGLNDVGQTAFRADLSGDGVTSANNNGIWSEGSVSLTLVARRGDPAPGTFSGVKYTGFDSPVFNDAGQTAFRAFLTVSNVMDTDGVGIWSEGSGSLVLIARGGNPAPGTVSGVNYSSFFGLPVLNNAGQTAFAARLAGSGVTAANATGIWSEGSGSLTMVARAGNPAPGTSSGVNYSGFGLGISDLPVLNEAGQTAFRGFLIGNGVTTANNNGIWSEGSGSLALVAREGDPAPGTSTGVNDSFLSFSGPALNGAGQTAFVADLTGNGITDANDRGIWATDANNMLQLIVLEGDSLEVAPGDVRIVSSVGFKDNTGNGDGRPSGFNDRGQLVFSAIFTDGSSGVFVSNRVAIPEPAALTLALCSSIFALTARRQPRSYLIAGPRNS